MSSAHAIRQFLRGVLLDPAGRRLVVRRLKSEKVMIKALELAASDPRTDEGGSTPISVDVRILNAISAMTPEAQKLYAETGKLPERYWEKK